MALPVNMRVLISVVILCVVAFTTAEQTSRKITIKAVTFDGVDEILQDLVYAIDFAFDYGRDSNTRVILLLNSLSQLNVNYRWSVVEDAQAFAHTAPMYAYFKVTKGLISHHIKIAASV